MFKTRLIKSKSKTTISSSWQKKKWVYTVCSALCWKWFFLFVCFQIEKEHDAENSKNRLVWFKTIKQTGLILRDSPDPCRRNRTSCMFSAAQILPALFLSLLLPQKRWFYSFFFYKTQLAQTCFSLLRFKRGILHFLKQHLNQSPQSQIASVKKIIICRILKRKIKKNLHASHLMLLTALNMSPTDMSAAREDKQHCNQHFSSSEGGLQGRLK